MLSPSENRVMKSILERCGQKGSCICSKGELLSKLLPRAGMSEKKLSSIMEGLEMDGYIDVVLSDRRGEIVYCISLLSKGKAFKRETARSVRNLLARAMLAVLSGVLTFIVGRLLVYFLS